MSNDAGVEETLKYLAEMKAKEVTSPLSAEALALLDEDDAGSLPPPQWSPRWRVTSTCLGILARLDSS